MSILTSTDLAANGQVFSVWQDMQHVHDSKRSMMLTGSLAANPADSHILFHLNNNLSESIHSQSLRFHVSNSDAIDKACPQAKSLTHINNGSAESLSSAASIVATDLSPLDNLPRIVCDMLSMQSSALSKKMTLPSEIRGKLLQTEVPLSRSADHAERPILRGVQSAKPRIVLPVKLETEVYPICCNSNVGEDRSQDLSGLLRNVDIPRIMLPNKSTIPLLSPYSTIKVSNIPWDISMEAVMEFLGKNTRLAPYTSACSPVHFVLDRTSGKTQSDVYIELLTTADAERFAQRKSGKSLGTRLVTVELTSSKEMLDALFPRWRPGFWLTAEEIQNVLTHAKTFKSPYTRKCPQRPFENFISILALFPWTNAATYAESQRELLYSGFVSIISILQWHISRGKIPALNTKLLQRLVTAGIRLTRFTVGQKDFVRSLAGNIAIENGIAEADSNHNTMEQAQLPAEDSSKRVWLKFGQQSESLRGMGIATEVANSGIVLQPVINETVVAPRPLAQVAKVIANPAIEENRDKPDLAKTEAFEGVLCDNQIAHTVAAICHETKKPGPIVPTRSQIRSKTPLSGESLREKWLQNARRAGIAVGVPTHPTLPR